MSNKVLYIKKSLFDSGDGFNSHVYTMYQQSDKKILVGGDFSTYDGDSLGTYGRIIRLNSDGSKDTSFVTGSGFGSALRSIYQQSDMKVLVGGDFTYYNGSFSYKYLIRLNSTGGIDSSFNIGSGFNGSVYSVREQSDGKVLVGGGFTQFTGNTNNYLIRLNSDGTKDTSFNIGSGFDDTVRSIRVQSDGKILVGGEFLKFTGSTGEYIVRLNSDGSLDNTFTSPTTINGDVLELQIQSDGKVLAGGLFSATGYKYLVRLNSNGTKDTSFDIGSGFNGDVNTIYLQSNKIFVGGNFTTFTGNTQNRLIRLNSDGTKDTSFDVGSNGFDVAVRSIYKQADGKLLVGGSFVHYKNITRNRIVRLNPDGSDNESDYSLSDYNILYRKKDKFDIGSGFNYNVKSIYEQSDGKILVGGGFTQFNTNDENYLIRLNSDGSKDTSFDIGSGFGNWVETIYEQSDGKILVGGNFTTFTGTTQNRIIRLNSDGTKDTNFDVGSGFNNNSVYSIYQQSDGKILVGGSYTQFTGSTQNRIIRLNSDGTKDTSFNIGSGISNGFNGDVETIYQQSDGKILVGGAYTKYKNVNQNRLIRLNDDGSKDTSFDIGSGFNYIVYSLYEQSDGKILVGGGFGQFTGSTQNRIIRLNSDGTKDTNFDVGSGFNNIVLSLFQQSDNKIMVGGSFTTFTGSTQNRIIRLNSDGTKDTNFDVGSGISNGFNDNVNTILEQTNGETLIGGNFTKYKNVTQNYSIRLNGDVNTSNYINESKLLRQ